MRYVINENDMRLTEVRMNPATRWQGVKSTFYTGMERCLFLPDIGGWMRRRWPVRTKKTRHICSMQRRVADRRESDRRTEYLPRRLRDAI